MVGTNILLSSSGCLFYGSVISKLKKMFMLIKEYWELKFLITKLVILKIIKLKKNLHKLCKAT